MSVYELQRIRHLLNMDEDLYVVRDRQLMFSFKLPSEQFKETKEVY